LSSELERTELKTAFVILQDRLRATIGQTQLLREERASELELSDTKMPELQINGFNESDRQTITFLNDALSDTAMQRDRSIIDTANALKQVDDITLEIRLMEERNDQIFRQIEEALTVSIKPLENVFNKVGLNSKSIIDTVRRGYAGYGGPFTTLSTGDSPLTPNENRTAAILSSLDEVNIYRIAMEKVPLTHPLKRSHILTSGYGRRWGKMHYGIDFAAPHATSIHSTADGVVVKIGWMSGYGRMIKIKHDFGFETRYAHLSKIRVKKGQMVSRGDHIGDMGNTGRSTGTHLHYEVRLNGKAANPMKYIKAARNVF
jgi:murein DD-endopeptidase MepM/ murein hydrolase activator NlpD